MNTTQLFPPRTTALLIVLTCVIVAACEQPTAIKQGYNDITSVQWRLDTTVAPGYIAGYLPLYIGTMKFDKDSTLSIVGSDGSERRHRWYLTTVNTPIREVTCLRIFGRTRDTASHEVVAITKSRLEIKPAEPTGFGPRPYDNLRFYAVGE